MKLTKNDKIIAIIFSAISILSFFVLTAFHIFNVQGVKGSKLFGIINLNDPFVYLDWTCFIGFLGMFYMSIKGIFVPYYKKLKRLFFKISTIVILCFMYVYNPVFYVVPFHPGAIFWIIVHFTGIILIIIFLMAILTED